jgi:hypothetical protein
MTDEADLIIERLRYSNEEWLEKQFLEELESVKRMRSLDMEVELKHDNDTED